MKFLARGSLLALLFMFWSSILVAQAEPVTADTRKSETAQKSDLPGSQPAGVVNIVFIDKADACECTEERIKSSWKALQSALKDRKDLRVTRIHYDTEKRLAERYVALRPLMVLPGIYFLNGKGGVLEVLQGEVKLKEITAILKKIAPTS